MTMYDSIVAKSFSRKEQKKLGYGAIFACLLTAFTFFTVFKPYLFTAPLVDIKVSMGVGLRMLMIGDTRNSQQLKLERAVENVTKIVTPGSVQNIHTTSSQEGNETKMVTPSSTQKNNFTSLGQENEASIIMSSPEQNVTSRNEENEASKIISGPKQNSTSRKEENEASKILSAPKQIFTSPKEENEASKIMSARKQNSSSPTEKEKVKKVPLLSAQNNNLTIHKEVNGTKKVQPVCNIEKQSDFCEISGDIRVDGNSSTVYIVSSNTEDYNGNTSWKIKPYARKGDDFCMKNVREWTVRLVKANQEIPKCTQNHSTPAVLFSVGGYAGNHYHATSDILLPLFLTSRSFNREVQFLTTDRAPWVISKFQEAMDGLSKYKHITIDKEQDIHCFPSMTVGLKHHKELGINTTKSQYTMMDFKEFLRSTYSLRRSSAIKLHEGSKKKPRFLLITRKGTRAFVNTGELVQTIKKLGFKVIVTEADSDIKKFSQVVNSCDVMMAFHGAGCTNIVFLPEKAVFIQVVGLGGMEWPARVFYGWPAKDMKLSYLEYLIKEQESTLIEQYPLDHPVFKDPSSITKSGWAAFKKIYMDKQNVRLDINRFRPTLLKARELLRE